MKDATTDTNSAPGTVVSARGAGAPRTAGGGVIVDANGNRLEIIPPARPKPAAQTKVLSRLPAALELPVLDDPAAGLAARKARAELLLGLGALAAVLLALWARKYRPR